MADPVRFAALGLDHRHMFGMAQGMIDAGCEFVSFWTEGEPQPLAGFTKRFPDVPREDELSAIWNDPTIPLVLIACPPDQRADLAIQAMRNGKDVMLDKPGCVTLAELKRIREVVAETGRIWSIDFSERFEVPAVTKAAALVREGVIGTVLQTVGLGPHRLNKHMRPDWFFEEKQYGGILGDIASHQIDQFLFLTGKETAEIRHAAVGNFGNPDNPRFQDFGELNLVSGNAQAYIRLDWFTPDALPNWGDGRLFILGTQGYIELRKYVDVCGRDGTDHLYLVTNDRCEYIDCHEEELPYFRLLAEDVRNRTETACPQKHAFIVTELALKGQEMAERRGYLAD
ncbi:Gfo/Idh/MocA family oxidoreductase [Rhodobacteraceae bacterium RKSG542]|uniref:Gfo/Idh/MocA family protein n=1 Tax=Pseudovibrio flavus TaxID=2529854 RepID=UPI0012BB9565|nr:Gfo/Idh/MocA family oxidoreductase [Pseudovibrio flavus]MTI15741.1 Gfo/Idh/MocA family oxidoreductase [Pseudovibrio flavus]